MILGISIVTDRALPISVAAELEMLAVLHRGSIQFEAVSEITKFRISEPIEIALR